MQHTIIVNYGFQSWIAMVNATETYFLRLLLRPFFLWSQCLVHEVIVDFLQLHDVLLKWLIFQEHLHLCKTDVHRFVNIAECLSLVTDCQEVANTTICSCQRVREAHSHKAGCLPRLSSAKPPSFDHFSQLPSPQGLAFQARPFPTQHET